jgi:hypothetical protein
MGQPDAIGEGNLCHADSQATDYHSAFSRRTHHDERAYTELHIRFHSLATLLQGRVVLRLILDGRLPSEASASRGLLDKAQT